MTAYKKLVALHVPSQETLEYGPWEVDEDPTKALWKEAFVHGFMAGVHAARTEGMGDPEDMTYEVVEVEPPGGNNIVGVLTAEASASVTHADGTVD